MVVVPALEMSGKLEAIVEISPVIMENGNSVELPEEKMMICASNREDNTFDENCEENTFQMEAPRGIYNHILPCKDGNEDVEVDVVEDVNPNEERVPKREIGGEDVTESSGSSSFGNTDSGTGNATVSSDVEVESQPRDVNASLLRFDEFRARKKRLTDHWRKFIRPLMWRCKWVELQLRELHSQASKYDRELEECDRKKQSELEKCATLDVGIKAVPFICHNRSVKLMKRKKRKRVEDTVDLTSYTSSHSLFSYYARKRPFADSTYMDNDHDNKDLDPAKKTPFGRDEFGLSSQWGLFKDSDAFETILRRIDEAQLLVHRLRMRVGKVVIEHAGKSSDVSSFVPDDPSASCAPNLDLPNVSTVKLPETSQHGQAIPLPDMVETADEVRIKDRREILRVQANDQPVKEELDNTNEIKIEHAESPPLVAVGKAGNAEIAPHPNSSSQKSVTREQSTVKTRSILKMMSPKNKRKRGRRKARSSRWNRRLSG